MRSPPQPPAGGAITVNIDRPRVREVVPKDLCGPVEEVRPATRYRKWCLRSYGGITTLSSTAYKDTIKESALCVSRLFRPLQHRLPDGGLQNTVPSVGSDVGYEMWWQSMGQRRQVMGKAIPALAVSSSAYAAHL